MNDLNKLKEDAESKNHLEVLEEMKTKLLNFKKEKKLFICENKPIKNEKFKNNFFQALENLLGQLELLKSEGFKITKAFQIYDWYKNKVIYLDDHYSTKQSSVPRYYEVIANPPNPNQTSNIWQAINFPLLLEKNKRTKDPDDISYKDKLKQYERRPNKIANLDSIKNSIENRPGFNNYVYKNCENKMKTLTVKNINSSDKIPTTKNTQHHCMDHNYKTSPLITNNNNNNNVRNEKGHMFKNTNNKTELTINKDIKISKNRDLSEKRFDSEKLSFMDDFASQFSKFKEEIQTKADIKEMISHYNIERKNNRNTDKSVFFNVKNDNVFKMNSSFKSNKRNHQESVVLNEARISKKLTNSNSESYLDVNSLSISHHKDKIDFIRKKFSKSTVPSEINPYTLLKDNVGSVRIQYSEIIREHDLEASHLKETHNETLPLSFYSRKHSPIVKKSMISTCDFKIIQPDKHDLLSMKRSFTNLNDLNVKSLKSELCNEGVNISMKALKRAFLSPTVTFYPKTYLPKSGFGLLSNPFGDKKERSMKKKKNIN
jgi:hypothetical protein